MAERTQRILVGAAALFVGVVIVVLVVAVLSSGGGGSSVATGPPPGAAKGVPPPPPAGSTVLAQEAGSYAVALAAEPRRVTAIVLSGSGRPASRLTLSFRAGGRTLKPTGCGAGCYRAALQAKPKLVEVLFGKQRATFRLPAASRPATAIVNRASNVFRNLRSLVYVESLSSDPAHRLVTTWTLGAPDRVAYKIRGGASAVVIGRHRWDRTAPGKRWVRSAQVPPLQVPTPTWGSGVSNAHLLGTARIGGRPVWVVSFVNSSIPAFFTAWVDRQSYRTLQLRMTAAAHFMFHRYLRFNAPVRITAP